jgi:NAD(P)H-dependent flavin oxidoreductase YrpB (nitropropane dioxygenase family)
MSTSLASPDDLARHARAAHAGTAGRGAGDALATAVSAAGGLGTLGASWTDPDVLCEQIRAIARATDAPFCVNLVLDFDQEERLEVALQERAPWISLSWGVRPDLIARAHAGGARVMVQVASADGAREAASAGADALIVQGVEAGGHVESVVGLVPLLVEVGNAVSVPLVAAGGIADPAAARAALAAGAQAIAMGTRFVASTECEAHPSYKSALVRAKGDETVLTDLFDIGWPAAHRVLRNSTFDRWDAAGRPPSGSRPGEGDIEAMAMYAGQGVGAIAGEEAAGEIVERFAYAALRR